MTVVDKTMDCNGASALAQAYLAFLYCDKVQDIADCGSFDQIYLKK